MIRLSYITKGLISKFNYVSCNTTMVTKDHGPKPNTVWVNKDYPKECMEVDHVANGQVLFYNYPMMTLEEFLFQVSTGKLVLIGVRPKPPVEILV